MSKGQLFLIAGLVIVIVLILIKTSLSLVKILENKRYLESGLETMEFRNIEDEIIKTVQISYIQKQNVSTNVNDFARFARSGFAAKTIELNGFFVESIYSSDSSRLNTTAFNFLGSEISFLNLTLNTSTPQSQLFYAIDEVLVNGAKWAVGKGYGTEKDLEHLEEQGCMKGADASKISNEAKKRGAPQLGTLGAGNHFLEIQVVDKIFLPEIAKVFGIEKEGQVTVMIHTGSRGFGHQVCTDYLRILESRFRDEIRKLPDRELVYAPSGTKECEDYFSSMAAAANYAWTNRSVIMHWVRESFVKTLGMKLEDIGLEVVYDVAHNIGKIEEHVIDGNKVKVYLHRKGATRTFPPGSPEIPKDHQEVGQCVIIPGSMGTASYVLVGAETAKETFYSTAHGAGRVSSRAKMLRGVRGEDVARELTKKGIVVRAASWRVLAEEADAAYKSVDEVVKVTQEAGISKIVARLIPIAVMKG